MQINYHIQQFALRRLLGLNPENEEKKSELCRYENILAAILCENGNSHKERDLLEEF